MTDASPETAAAVARALIEIGAVGLRVNNPITFKSGIVSPVYVDNRTLPFHPNAWRVVIDGFRELIAAKIPSFDVIAGVAVGGVPHSSTLGYLTQRPSVFIRKEVKDHGTGKRVEGGDVRGKTVLLVEDLITTGGSSLSAINALRAEGAVCNTTLVIVTYDFAEARTNFAAAGVTALSLTSFPVILAEGAAMGKFSATDIDAVKAWLDDPHGWASRTKR